METDKLKELALEKLGPDLAKMYDEACMSASPAATVTFAQVLQNRQTQEVADTVYDLSNMFRMLAFNIVYNDMIEDKVAALQELAGEFVSLVQGATEKAQSNSLLDWVKELNPFRKSNSSKMKAQVDLGKLKSPGFYVFKDANQHYRWVAIHSNNFEDREGEVIASFAHKEFVEAVDAGRWPMPELWVWHSSPSSAVGRADMLHYDEETGFNLSTGTFFKDKEHVAEGLAKYPHPLRTSHGMPREHLIYAVDDPTMIVHYRTREISPLPIGAEANKYTPFAIFNGG